MGRNAKRKAARAFTPTPDDIDLQLELIGLPADGGMVRPALVTSAQSDLGREWFTPERKLHLCDKAQALTADGGSFAESTFHVLREAVADGLVVLFVPEVEDLLPQVHWNAEAAWRTRSSRR